MVRPLQRQAVERHPIHVDLDVQTTGTAATTMVPDCAIQLLAMYTATAPIAMAAVMLTAVFARMAFTVMAFQVVNRKCCRP